jgi:hypothetical protein
MFVLQRLQQEIVLRVDLPDDKQKKKKALKALSTLSVWCHFPCF